MNKIHMYCGNWEAYQKISHNFDRKTLSLRFDNPFSESKDISEKIYKMGQDMSNDIYFFSNNIDVFLSVRCLIRDGVLKPDQVSIVYFNFHNDEAFSEIMDIDSDGRITYWPKGFFDNHTILLSKLLKPKKEHPTLNTPKGTIFCRIGYEKDEDAECKVIKVLKDRLQFYCNATGDDLFEIEPDEFKEFVIKQPKTGLNQLISKCYMKTFEIELEGFDGGTGKTDHLIKWVNAEDKEALEKWLAKENPFNMKYQSIVDITDELRPLGFGDGVDYIIHPTFVEKWVRHPKQDTEVSGIPLCPNCNGQRECSGLKDRYNCYFCGLKNYP